MLKSFALTCHSSTPADAVEAVAVRVERSAANVLSLKFSIDGQLEQLRIPAVGASRMGPLLWQHTCFEVFIARDGNAAYHEINLSPSLAWTVHAFRAYRDGGPLSDKTLAPTSHVRRIPHRLELDSTIALDRLSPEYHGAVLRLGLAAVIELVDGRLTYWSLQHSPGRPDLHAPSAFAVRLGP